MTASSQPSTTHLTFSALAFTQQEQPASTSHLPRNSLTPPPSYKKRRRQWRIIIRARSRSFIVRERHSSSSSSPRNERIPRAAATAALCSSSFVCRVIVRSARARTYTYKGEGRRTGRDGVTRVYARAFIRIVRCEGERWRNGNF